MPIDDQSAPAAGSAALAAAYAGPDYGAVLWEPTAESTRSTQLAAYARWLKAERGLDLDGALDPGGGLSLDGYQKLWEWSVGDPGTFWDSVRDHFGVLGGRGSGAALAGGPMPDVRWFGGATLNYARNALRAASTDPDRIAVIYRGEDGRGEDGRGQDGRGQDGTGGTLTYGELDRAVAGVAAGLRALGVTTGDRVAAYLPNVPEALIGMLASATEFTEVPFHHPLWVLYSSGTTGLPKPIVHGHGGIVLEHLKVLSFYQDLRPGDVFFWYTTTGWMMWNYLAGGLLAGVTVVLYEGAATYPAPGALWELISETGVTYAGTGAPYLLACAKAGLRPGAEHDLSRLRGIGSTGSPLPPEGFDWVYAEVGRDLVLGSMPGGTDVCTGFVGASPLHPVRAGVIAGRFLGAKVEAFDEAGQPVTGEVGELVVTEPMPSMPVGFWNDPAGERYHSSYYAGYPRRVAARRLDHVPARRRVGHLRPVGCHFEPRRRPDRHQRVLPRRGAAAGNRGQPGRRHGPPRHRRPARAVRGHGAGQELDEALAARIRAALRAELSPRHAPDEIHPVPGIPRTLSGKKVEVPVRKILLGTPLGQAADPDSLANPEVLKFFAPQEAK